MGLLTNSARGVWATTEAGRSVPEDQIKALLDAYRARLQEERERKRRDREAEGVAGEGEAAEDEDDDWQTALINRLLTMPPDSFERLAKRLLREAGFVNTQTTPSGGDGGIDGVGVYRLSLVSFPVFFQCKRYRGSVGAEKVRDFRGAMMGRGDRGLLITTGTFTTDAKREATRVGALPIDLIDGERLCDLLKEHKLGVVTTIKQVERVEIEDDFFSDL